MKSYIDKKFILSGGKYIRQLDYWKEKYQDNLEEINIYSDFENLSRYEYVSEIFIQDLPKHISEKIISMCKGTDVSIYIFLVTTVKLLLFLYLDKENICLAAPILNEKDVEHLNDYIIFCDNIKKDNCFKEVLLCVKQTVLEAFENQDYPFEILAEHLDSNYINTNRPLIGVSSSLKNIQNNINAEKYHIDFAFDFAYIDNKIVLEWKYNSKVISNIITQILYKSFCCLLEQILNNVTIHISDISLLTNEEDIIKNLSFRNKDYNTNTNLHTLFEKQVEKTPNNIAIIFENQKLTYEELNNKSNVLAYYLKKKGLNNNNIVALVIDNSFEMIIAILGVLKAGGAYLPIDPEYPQERIAHMMSDCSTKIVITSSQYKNYGQFANCVIETIDIDNFNYKYTDNLSLNIKYSPCDLAYIIYTSGTTGIPKGVMVEHRNVLNEILSYTEQCNMPVNKNCMLATNYTFDPSVAMIFSVLSTGSTLVLIKKKYLTIRSKFIECCIKHKVNVINFSPSALKALLSYDAKLKDLNTIISGSEKLADSLKDSFVKKGYILFNNYGPTETTVDAIIHKCQLGQKVVLGKPIVNNKVYIVNSQGKLQPIGGVGEIWISGPGVARGYINNVEETKEKFIADPFEKGRVLYKTGDKARWTIDGNIEFIGRYDNQVKINGFRIELGEIENAINSMKDVDDVIVRINDRGNENIILRAFIIAKEKQFTSKDISDYLKKKLPHYMIPSEYIFLENFPLLNSGKVDRRALDKIEKTFDVLNFEEPRNDEEIRMLKLWKNTLGDIKIGINNDFFELGGHSLKATQLIAHIAKEFNIELSLRTLFEKSTIKDLVELIQNKNPLKQANKIIKQEDREFYLASSVQRRLYFLMELETKNTAYNIPRVLSIEGRLDRKLLEHTISILIQRHESLRTSFHLVDGQVVQKIYKTISLPIIYSKCKENEIQDEIEEFVKPFELSKVPLWRINIVELDRDKYLLLFDMHHIITDGLSMNIFVNDFIKVYNGIKLKPLEVQYRDYSEWQRSLLSTNRLLKQKNYWKKLLEGEIPSLELPLDFARPKIQCFEGETVSIQMPSKLVFKVKNASGKSQLTDFMIYLTAFYILLKKYSNQNDIIIGTPVSGRTNVDVSDVIGVFINTLPLRITTDNSMTIYELLEQIKFLCIDSFENQDYPLEELISNLDLPHDWARNPLFDVLFSYERVTKKDFKQIHNLKFTDVEFKERVTQFDLILDISEDNDDICVRFSYCIKLFKKETIMRMMKHFFNILDSITENKNQRIGLIDMLTYDEKKEILINFNHTETEFSREKTVIDLFEKQVTENPNRIAIIFKDTFLTYDELNKKANQFARILKNMEIGRDDIVGVMQERSINLIVSLFAIEKVGAAYLPIEPYYPDKRIKYILDDSNTKILITEHTFIEMHSKSTFHNCQIIYIEDTKFDINDDTNLNLSIDTNRLAYVIYTSGSTGEPKGTLIEHHSLTNRINWMQKMYPLCKEDKILQKTPYIFDVSVWELFWWSVAGAQMCFLEPKKEKDPEEIIKAIYKYRITIIHFVPTMLNAFLKYLEVENTFVKISSLKNVFSSGESLKLSDVNLFHKLLYKTYKTKLINLYGPTEATIDVSYYNCFEAEETDIIPIGKPIDNVNLLILGKDGALQPVNVHGELYIIGEGLARGYLNKEELTEEKFLDNTFLDNMKCNRAYTKMYKTGDVAKWLPDGNIAYLGRLDNQVKIKGVRIELEEIENEMMKLNSVKNVVATIKNNGETQELCVYYTSENEISNMKLKNMLKSKLPDYMIPQYFIKLDEIPILNTGKVDYKKLSDSVFSYHKSSYEMPSTKTEISIATIWKDILGENIVDVDITESFFNLGGDSIKAIQLISKINKELFTHLHIQDLYSNATIKELSAFIDENVFQTRLETNIKVEIEQQMIEQKELILKEAQTMNLLPQDIEDIYPASDIEISMIYYSLRFADQSVYHEQFVAPLVIADFDIEIMRKAMKFIVMKHSAFRSVFNLKDFNQVMKIIHKKVEINLEYDDISEYNFEQVNFYVKEYMKKERREPFNITLGELWKMKMFKTQEEGIVLVFSFHHAILDGWSNALFITELYETYCTILEKGDYKQELLAHNYKHFVIEQELLKRNRYIKEFWVSELKDYKRLILPKCRMDDGQGNVLFEGKEYFFEKVKRLAVQNNTDIKTVCFTAFILSMYTYSYDNDFIVGLVENCRPECIDGDKILGCFLNTVPFRVQVNGQDSWSVFIEDINKKIIDIKLYGRLSLHEIAKAIGEKSESFNPFFDVIFNYVDFHMYREKPKEIIMKQNIELGFERGNSSMEFKVSVTSKELLINVNYSNNVFSKELIHNIIEIFKNAINIMDMEPETIISRRHLLAKDSVNKIINTFNMTDIELDTEKNVIKQFEFWADKIPNSIAVEYEEESITYKELDNKVNQLAEYLKEHGIEKKMIIGFMPQRTSYMLIGILAIWKIGAAYVPIDQEYPISRIRYMIENSGINTMLVCDDLEINKQINCNIINITNPAIYQSHIQTVKGQCDLNDIAYVIYTSGSTGKPKGVIISQLAVYNYGIGLSKRIDFSMEKSILAVTTISFDIFITETIIPLTQGMKVIIANKEQQKDTGKLLKLIDGSKVEMIQMTPSRMKILLTEKESIYVLTHVKEIMIGGEKFNQEMLSDLLQLKNTKIYNMYGPTETTVWSSIKQVISKDELTIGTPIANTNIYILSKDMDLLPIGVSGDMYIGGKGLANGYINNSTLTKKCFVNNPFIKNKIIYMTGDKALWTEKGELIFNGREDYQVKIRGYRIELGEIEECLKKYPDIDECFAKVVQHSNEDIIVAYYVSKKIIEIEKLHKYLNECIPEYMIPSTFVHMDKIPLNTSGKIDRLALPDIEQNRPLLKQEYISPSNDIEKNIAMVWEEVLGINNIGTMDNYFSLGGNSFNIVQAFTQIDLMYPKILNITDFFSYPTINKLSKFIIKQQFAKSTSFILKGICLNDEDSSNEPRNVSDFKFRLENELYSKVNYIMGKKSLHIIDLIACAYIYSLAEISNQSVITVYTMLDNSEFISDVTIDLKNINSYTEYVNTFHTLASNNKIPIDMSSSIKKNNSKETIVLICNGRIYNNISNDIFDIIMYVLDESDYIDIKLRSNGKVSESKTEVLLERQAIIISFLQQVLEKEGN